jgi:ubiquinone/menaquinone biosynthesis C-methylase UbiE
MDLHEGFRDPERISADDLERFLEAANQLPGIRAIQREMRNTLALRPGMSLLDAGCGIGVETTRLAVENPEIQVTGLDRNAALLRIADRRAGRRLPNLRWLEGDITALELSESSFDALRAERVLMYLPGDGFERAIDDLVCLLRPGGRLALFELDYGATMLAPGAASGEVLQRADEALRESVPQQQAGRRIPGLLTARGLRDVVATPFSFSIGQPIWRRIVGDTLAANGSLDAGISIWLREQAAAAVRGEFVAAFTGVLTTASRP